MEIVPGWLVDKPDIALISSAAPITLVAGRPAVQISGQPLEEPVAWYGPIVMNTQAELQQAVAELRNGTFIKHS
jgi:redox-sensitive bicupin YhaK (pirin superfamily)